MAIRVIGNTAGNTGRILKPKKRDGVAENREPERQEIADGSEHEPNEHDNEREPNADGQSDFVDIESIDTGDSNSGGARTYTGKRRGRKPGSTNKSSGGKRSGSSTSKTTDSITSMLYVVHSVAGSLLKMPSLKIPKTSCADLAEAITEVTQLYDIPLLDEKGMAWANLAAVAVKVYIFNGQGTIVKDQENQRVSVVSEPMPIPDWMRGGVN